MSSILWRHIIFLNYLKIIQIYKKYFRGRIQFGKWQRDALSKATKSTSRAVTRVELGNLLENFKTDLISTIGSQIDTLKSRKRQEEKNEVLSIFCPKCRNKHPLNECPFDIIDVYGICAKIHLMKNFPKIEKLKAINKKEGETKKSIYYVAPPRSPSQPKPTVMSSNTKPQFSYYQNHVQNTYISPIPWHDWLAQQLLWNQLKKR